ncbi:MAG: hypothetical protein IKR17_02685 [Bacteroidales bacterium]|nr:hypothetical protein [Bacteroidales bacterium]
MTDPIYLYLSLLLAPISSVVTWYASRRKRRTDDIDNLQHSIESLAKRNNELYEEIIRLQRDNLDLQREQARLIAILTPEQLIQYQQLKRKDQ